MRGTLTVQGAKKPVTAITGTLAVALLLAGTRWGSYIGYAPLFLTDVLIALAVIHAALGHATRGTKALSAGRRRHPPLMFIAFFAYLVLRALLSVEYAFTMDWVRDFVPFAYGVLAFISAASFAVASKEDQARTMKWIWGALIFHLLWTAGIVLSGVNTEAFPRMPASEVPVFSARPDTDMAILGITAALMLRRVLLKQNRFWATIGMLLAIVTATGMHSRAGLLSMALSLTTAYVITYAAVPKSDRNRRTLMTLAVPVLLSVAAAGVAQTNPGQRLIASVFQTSTGAEYELNAQGTERAREMAWEGVTDWTLSDPSRFFFGGGFGNDFLSESGVLDYLQGTEYVNVRSPHNWLVGVLARTGIVGVGLAVLILGALVVQVGRTRARLGQDELPAAAALIVLGIIPVALLGVVLESPFGAVPFWWAAGILFALRAEEVESAGCPKNDTARKESSPQLYRVRQAQF
ncbi:O-antigen ligase family protein [Arthrobacter sp. Soc17.1.1.1]|uniref:O-antigen ligase family protein n=1 Tax=Arthrobacter sp. Soc17.1.1.1 TaxID=3121277 RepID=UPI002FE4C69D